MAQCSALTRDGEPCHIPAPEGKKYCHIHHRQRRRRNLLSLATAGAIFLSVLAILADITGVLGYFGANWPLSRPQPQQTVQSTPPAPDRVEVDKATLRVYERSGKELWSRSISGLISRAVIEDLDNDLEREVIIGVTEVDTNVQNPGKDSGKLIVYRSDGKLGWELALVDFAPYATNVGAATGTIVVRDFIVANLDKNPDKEIVVLTNDLMWYPSKLTVVTAQGIPGAEYWHPGFIYEVIVARSRNEDRSLLIARAVNNDLALTYNNNPSSVFALDPANMAGQAPPYVFEDIEKGTQLWYGVLPLPTTIQEIQVRAMVKDTDEIAIRVSTGHFLYLDLLSGQTKRIAAAREGIGGTPPKLVLYK